MCSTLYLFIEPECTFTAHSVGVRFVKRFADPNLLCDNFQGRNPLHILAPATRAYIHPPASFLDLAEAPPLSALYWSDGGI